MSRRHRLVPLILALVVGVLALGSCSEDSDHMSADGGGPATTIVDPVSDPTNPMDVSDSLDIYVAALDDESVSRVEVWAWLENREEADLVGSLAEPLLPEEVPDSVQVPGGYACYYKNWATRQIRNGTVVRLYAWAYDNDGHATRSDLVVVRVLNKGGNLYPPSPQIVVTPRSGKVDQFFSFDASGTRDSVDTAENILVRWDFDGNGTFEIDWNQGAVASTIQQFKYPKAGEYHAKVEAKNTYVPNETGTAAVTVTVTQGDRPLNPPERSNYVLVPAGTYSVGTPDTLSGDSDERPIHSVTFTSGYYIEKTEVSNRLYLRFLGEAMSGQDPLVRRENNLLVYKVNVVDPVEPESLPQPIVDLTYSAMFFDPDSGRIVCDPQDRTLPVTGVTWHGARFYAEYFGMRLPTEHEWEIAAKGSNSGFIYPWGTTIAPRQANYLDANIRELVPIRTYTEQDMRGPFEIYELSGNAAEWVRDWYGSYSSGEVANPEGPFSGTLKVIRGGSFYSSASGVRVTARSAILPATGSREIGFRTAFTDPGR